MPIVLSKPKQTLKKAMKAVSKVLKKKKPMLRKGKMKMKAKPSAIVKKPVPKKVPAPGTLYNSQRAQYEKAMNAAQKKGGSNGVGVGY